jgi:hypothetical protein
MGYAERNGGGDEFTTICAKVVPSKIGSEGEEIDG